jgi:hypothetical protein
LNRRSALSNVSFSPTRTSAKRLASFPLSISCPFSTWQAHPPGTQADEG